MRGLDEGHVLTHVARNADGLATLVRAAVDGSGETMYVSDQVRDNDIEAGADRERAALVADIRASAEALAQALPRLNAVSADTVVHRTPGASPSRSETCRSCACASWSITTWISTPVSGSRMSSPTWWRCCLPTSTPD